MRRATLRVLILTGGLLLPAGCPSEHQLCGSDEDCVGGQICDVATGRCVYECLSTADCGHGFSCEQFRCVFHCSDQPLCCPPDMIAICGVFCIDPYEASRPDATAFSEGLDETRASSRPGVMPWYSRKPYEMNQAVAAAACAAAGKRLCTAQEWNLVCGGLSDLNYSYGDVYDPTVCNGIDTFCYCSPYPHCYQDCGADYRAMPTGSFAGCTNSWGVWDINGNVWELVASMDGQDHYRGGAYNCGDSEKLHTCGYDATWNPSAKGFRCCADGQP